MSAFYPPKVFGLDCCWICHRAIKLPLQSCNLRHLGLKRIHEHCFAPDVFKTLGADIVIVVGERGVQERTQLTWQQERKNNQQGDLFTDMENPQ